MNILITLPKHLIDKILSGEKEFEMRKCLPKKMKIGEDGFFVVEKGTDNVRCWCRVDEVRETYIDVLTDGRMDIDFIGINTTNGLINQVEGIARAEGITISNIDDMARQLNDRMFNIIKSVMERKASTFNF